MATLSKEDKILDALTGPWTSDAYADYLQEVYGPTGLMGDELHMNRGIYSLCHYPDSNITTHIYTFHDEDDKKFCVANMSMDSKIIDGLMAWLKPTGGRHLVALLEEIDNPFSRHAQK